MSINISFFTCEKTEVRESRTLAGVTQQVADEDAVSSVCLGLPNIQRAHRLHCVGMLGNQDDNTGLRQSVKVTRNTPDCKMRYAFCSLVSVPYSGCSSS